MPARHLLAALLALVALPSLAGDLPVTLAGLRDVKLLDSGSFVVSGSPPFAREETFEFLRRPDGGVFVMEFDLWTDDDDRPMGYRINRTGGKASTAGIVGFRKGYEDVRDRLIAGAR